MSVASTQSEPGRTTMPPQADNSDSQKPQGYAIKAALPQIIDAPAPIVNDGPLPESDVDVLVVGGGPVGLYLCAQLNAYFQDLSKSNGDAGVRQGAPGSPPLTVRVVERAAGLSEYSKGMGLHAGTMETLLSLSPGVAAALLREGTALGSIRAWTRTGTPIIRVPVPPPRTARTLDALPLTTLVSQVATERALAAHAKAAGCRVDMRCELLSLSAPDAEADPHARVVAVVRDVATGRAERVRCRYVVGCDGAHSTVRRTFATKMVGALRPEIFWMADATIRTSDGRATRWHLDGGSNLFHSAAGAAVVLTVDAKKGIYRFVLARKRTADAAADATTAEYVDKRSISASSSSSSTKSGGAGARAGSPGASSPAYQPTRAEFEAALNAVVQPPWSQVVHPADARPGDAARSGFALGDVHWLTAFRVHQRRAETYRPHPRAFLAGDAAHVHSPMGGQGLNTGVQDAANLAWKLAVMVHSEAAADSAAEKKKTVGKASIAPSALSASYEDERLPVAAAVLAASGAGTAIVTQFALLFRTVFNVIVPLLFWAFPSIWCAAGRAFGGLNYRYRSSLISGSGAGSDSRLGDWIWTAGGAILALLTGNVRLTLVPGTRAPTRVALERDPRCASKTSASATSKSNGSPAATTNGDSRDFATSRRVSALELYAASGPAHTVLIAYCDDANLGSTPRLPTIEIPEAWRPWIRVKYVRLLTHALPQFHPSQKPPSSLGAAADRLRNEPPAQDTSSGDLWALFSGADAPADGSHSGNSLSPAARCRHWVDVRSDLAWALFGVRHHRDFNGAARKPWAVVVRPDGYVALAGQWGDPMGPILRHLRTYMPVDDRASRQ